MKESVAFPGEPVLKYIPLSELRPSKFNHRKTINEAQLEELANSIRANGILQPLNVRPHLKKGQIDHYEIGGGERRYLAADRAGLDFVPCFVREMDDAAFVTLVQVENLQRVDAHPLEEADGYVDLMHVVGADVAKVSAIIGKEERYIRERLQLLKLIPEAKEMFRDDRFSLGHAIEISKQTSDVQAKIIDFTYGPLWVHEEPDGLFTELEQEKRDNDPFFARAPITTNALKAWINNHIRFDVKADIVPSFFPETAEAAARVEEAQLKTVAITYLHRTNPDVKGGRIFGPDEWRRADGTDEAPACNVADMGLVVAGPHRGEMFAVCTDKKNCDTHFADEIKAAKKTAKIEAAASVGDPNAQKAIEKEARKRAATEAANIRAKKIDDLARPILRAAAESVIVKAKSADLGIKGRVGNYVLDCLTTREFWFGRDRRKDIPKTGSADAIVRAIALACLKDGDEHHDNASGDAKALGVNVAKIVKDATAQVAKEDKAAAAKSSPNKKN